MMCYLICVCPFYFRTGSPGTRDRANARSMARGDTVVDRQTDLVDDGTGDLSVIVNDRAIEKDIQGDGGSNGTTPTGWKGLGMFGW